MLFIVPDLIIYNFLVFTGLYIVLIWLYENLKSPIQIIYNTLLPIFVPNERKSLLEKYGKWAVITGSTDGIGKQYALELASKGMNICLISRTKQKLEAVAKEIEATYKVETKYIVADLSHAVEVIPQIEKELKNIPVGILINNAGLMYEYPDVFDNVPEHTLWNLLNVNMTSLTMITRLVLPGMKKRGKGLVVNLSSGSAMQPLPYTCVYGASKVYVKNFTLALRYELASHGIDVQLVTPMFVRTKMNYYSTSVTKGNMFCPDVVSYTKWAVAVMGKTDYTTGYWAHGIQIAFMRFVPEVIKTIIGGQMNLKFRKEYDDQQKDQEKLK